MFKGIHHFVVAVENLEEAAAQYAMIFDVPVPPFGDAPARGFKNAVFDFGDTQVELITPFDETGPVARRISTSGEGPYMLAMSVDSIDTTVAHLREKGVRLIGDPGEGKPLDKAQIFIHPQSANGLLIRIAER